MRILEGVPLGGWWGRHTRVEWGKQAIF